MTSAVLGAVLRDPIRGGAVLRGRVLRGAMVGGPVLRLASRCAPILGWAVLCGPVLRRVALRGPVFRCVVLCGPVVRRVALCRPVLRCVAVRGLLAALRHGVIARGAAAELGGQRRAEALAAIRPPAGRAARGVGGLGAVGPRKARRIHASDLPWIGQPPRAASAFCTLGTYACVSANGGMPPYRCTAPPPAL